MKRPSFDAEIEIFYKNDEKAKEEFAQFIVEYFLNKNIDFGGGEDK